MARMFPALRFAIIPAIPMPPKPSSPIKLMVSSSVYDKEPFLAQVDAVLTGYGYDVIMASRGKMFANPKLSTHENCLAAVKECHVFLGIISGHYGSEMGPKKVSITHMEMRRAIELNKRRWFLVHHDVTIASQLFEQFRYHGSGKKRRFAFARTPVLSDIRVLDLYDEVTKSETANWAQPYLDETSALQFLDKQFSDPERIRRILA
jgi:Domain of unknown function (DUF4062)